MLKRIQMLVKTVALSAGFLGLGMAPANLPAVEISDGPMEVLIHTAPPVLMLLLDNSGSMDSELMTSEPYGLFDNAYYIFADQAYTPHHDHLHGSGHALSGPERRAWKTRWAGYNRLYYSPRCTYAPWPSTRRHVFRPADLDRPRSNPVDGNGPKVRINLAGTFFSLGAFCVPNAHYFVRSSGATGQQTYLVTWEDADRDGALDLGGSLINDRRKYYRLADDGDGLVEADELMPVMDEIEKNSIRPVIRNSSGGFERYATDREELQNFANWFCYHRRRELAAKAAAAGLIAGSAQKYIGLYALNGNPRIAAQPVRLNAGGREKAEEQGDNSQRLLDALYAMESGGRTPLRYALDQVGRYYHQDLPSDLGPSPFREASRGGGCQRAAAVVVTDGLGNGPAPAVGNADGDDGRPYADGWSNTLADVAVHYYAHDLAPGLPDEVPSIGCDDAPHQHMTTYVLSFGIPGTAMEPSAAGPYKANPCLLLDSHQALSWPPPTGGDDPELPDRTQPAASHHQDRSPATAADNLWHAAINGRGSFLDIHCAQNPAPVFADLPATADAFASSSGVAVNAGTFCDQSVIYQAQYHTDDWRGEVTATAQGGRGRQLWRASHGLQPGARKWDSRRIVTYGGGWREPQGVPFRYRHLSSTQKAALGSDLFSRSRADKEARKLVQYIRGRAIDGYRIRANLLGDIVHASPVLFGKTLYVGSNDGMLHAFDVRDGRERFAYVPNLVLPHLKALASPSYPDHHRFYVDGPAYAGEVLVGRYQRKTYLVGGLGKGGRGYYCMLLGHRQRPQTGDGFGDYQWVAHVDQIGPGGTERDVAQYIRWEYPRPQPDNDGMDNDGDGVIDESDEADPDLGFSFSRAFCVNGNSPAETYRPVVIFGNGYNSANQSAVLYVLAADSGALIRKIDTGIAADNGLSTPALVDVDLDRRVDYAYAGDLQGNLWKFDLTAGSPAQWGVAYGEDKDGDGVIDARRGDLPAPLFQAVGQPITGRPDVMIMSSMCATQAPGYLVVFGTGQYLGAPDRRDQSQQSIYGIWDYGDDSDDSEHLGAVVDRGSGLLSSGFYLLRQAIKAETAYERNAQGELDIGKVHYATVADDADGDGISVNNRDDSQQDDPEKYVGWFYDFPPSLRGEAGAAERVTADAVIRGGKAIFTSYVPDNAPCGSGGSSRLYILTGCDGAITGDSGGRPLLPIHIKGKLNDHPVMLKDQTRFSVDRLVTSDQQGNILTIDFEGEKWGRVSWRQTSAD